jgi:hypothetical protein
MPIPVIILVGQAGSGKDTVGKIIADRYNGVCIGQADPMKRFVRDVFGFTPESLWGTTELRNVVRPINIREAHERYNYQKCTWLDSILPPGSDIRPASDKLDIWWNTYIEGNGQLSARSVLQTLGTEFGRQSVDSRLWTNLAYDTALGILTGGTSYSRDLGTTKQPGTNFDFVVITDGRFRNEVVSVTSRNGVAIKIDRKVNPLSIVGRANSEVSRSTSFLPPWTTTAHWKSWAKW